MSSQSHLPQGEFSVMFPELYVTLQGVGTRRVQLHVIPEPRITLQGAAHGEFTVMIPEPYATLQGAVT